MLNNILVTEVADLFQAASGNDGPGDGGPGGQRARVPDRATATSLFVGVPADEPASGAALDFTPAAGSPAASGGLDNFSGAIAVKAAGVVSPTIYRGAAGTGGTKWWEGWTKFAVN